METNFNRFVGIANYKQNCYLNVILQFLLNNKDISQLLLEEKTIAFMNLENLSTSQNMKKI